MHTSLAPQCTPRSDMRDEQTPQRSRHLEQRLAKGAVVSTPQSASSARSEVRQVAPKLIELSETVLYGDVWERPGLSKRDRSLITLAALTAMYRGDQLSGHIERALANGVTREAIGEPVTHLAFYAGWPAATTRGPLGRKVFDGTKS